MKQATFSQCVLARWQPGFNDPYLLSWVMVAVYVLAAALAVVVLRRAAFPEATRRREQVFWGLVAAALVFMAVNKQADLQTFLLSVGHCMARAQDWFGQRLVVKRIGLTLFALTAIIGGLVFLWGLRRTLRRTGLPLAGLALIAGFILLRAAEMFHFRGPIMARFRGNWPDRILEMAGPILIIVAALILLGQVRARSRPAGG